MTSRSPGFIRGEEIKSTVAEETGLIGTPVLLWHLVSVVRYGFSTTQRLSDPYLKIMGAALIAGFFGVSVPNAAETIFAAPVMNTCFRFLAGIMAGLAGLEAGNGREQDGRPGTLHQPGGSS